METFFGVSHNLAEAELLHALIRYGVKSRLAKGVGGKV